MSTIISFLPLTGHIVSVELKASRLLSAGPYTTSYLAFDNEENAQVVKVPRARIEYAETIESKIREWQQHQSLTFGSHANFCIPAIVDLSESVFSIGLLVPYFADVKDCLEWTEIPSFLRRLASTIAFLHKLDAVHGNISRGNVRARRLNEQVHPVLIDIGFEELLSSIHGERSGIPRSHDPPERFATAEQDDDKSMQAEAASDVYMFAMLALELYGGYHPLSRLSGARLVRKMDELKRFGFIPEQPNIAPDDVWLVLAPCLSIDPGPRPTMAEVHAGLVDLNDAAGTHTG